MQIDEGKGRDAENAADELRSSRTVQELARIVGRSRTKGRCRIYERGKGG